MVVKRKSSRVSRKSTNARKSPAKKPQVKKVSAKKTPATNSVRRPGSGRRPVRKRPVRKKTTARWRIYPSQLLNKISLPVLKKTAYWSSLSAAWVFIIGSAIFIYFTFTLPDPTIAGLTHHPSNIRILDSHGRLLNDHGMRINNVRIDRLPEHLAQAVIAIEDRRFYYHFGVDPIGLVRAAIENWRAGSIVQGGSTLTQQLAKNLFLQPDRTMVRKVQEMLLAIWLEIKFSKKEILELYLNRVYFGAGQYGVEAASRRYFNKSARNVSLAEAAMLAGLLKAPSRYTPIKNPHRARHRSIVVLQTMRDTGMISGRQAELAIKQPARVRPGERILWNAYAIDWILEILPGYIGHVEEDVIVETSLDIDLQKIAQNAVSTQLKLQGPVRSNYQAAAVILDRRGAIKALVGGRSYRKSQFNRAVKAYRQPGSVFKPFVYLSAIETGMTPDTIVEDRPIQINGWSPRNYSGKYRGAVTLRDGLAQSINTVAVRLLLDVGRNRVVQTARRLGIRSDLHNSPSIALGTGEVTLLEITGAYVPFSNGGHGVLPHIIKRVRTRDGRVLYNRRGHGPGLIIKPGDVGAMNDMMQETLLSGTGRSARLMRHPAAGKTGTTQDSRDAWFIGYTAYYTAGVWVGKDDSKKMIKMTGGGLPANIWRDIMNNVHNGLSPRQLPGRYVSSFKKMPLQRKAQNLQKFNSTLQ